MKIADNYSIFIKDEGIHRQHYLHPFSIFEGEIMGWVNINYSIWDRVSYRENVKRAMIMIIKQAFSLIEPNINMFSENRLKSRWELKHIRTVIFSAN